jgi:uncharacterized protein YecE (DUF72 family)
MMELFIGTSGYSYPHWAKGVFYPLHLPTSRWLEYYTNYFKTVELNVSFYRLLPRATFKKWAERVPPGFQFAVKGSRLITHLKQLKDCEEALATFLESARGLGGKRAVTLWQFPPQFKLNSENLKKLINFGHLLQHQDPKCHQVFEFRDKSWFCEEVLDFLAKADFSLCQTEEEVGVERFSFVYIRKHGSGARYSSCYSNQQLQIEAKKITQYLTQKKPVYIYFNNDAYGYAVKNALFLKKIFETH